MPLCTVVAFVAIVVVLVVVGNVVVSVVVVVVVGTVVVVVIVVVMGIVVVVVSSVVVVVVVVVVVSVASDSFGFGGVSGQPSGGTGSSPTAFRAYIVKKQTASLTSMLPFPSTS